MKSIKVDFKGKYATIEFDESVISAQEVARQMSVTPHMMGKDMEYDGTLLLNVAGVKDEATGKKATTALSKADGVAKVKLYREQQAVGIDFTAKGKATSKQLIEALEAAGLKGTQYGTPAGTGGQARNGGNNSTMPGMAMGNGGMAMGNGGMAMGNGGMAGMGCGCAPSGVVYPYYAGPAPAQAYIRGGCGCGR